jgi:hypothetical protein
MAKPSQYFGAESKADVCPGCAADSSLRASLEQFMAHLALIAPCRNAGNAAHQLIDRNHIMHKVNLSSFSKHVRFAVRTKLAEL